MSFKIFIFLREIFLIEEVLPNFKGEGKFTLYLKVPPISNIANISST